MENFANLIIKKITNKMYYGVKLLRGICYIHIKQINQFN